MGEGRAIKVRSNEYISKQYINIFTTTKGYLPSPEAFWAQGAIFRRRIQRIDRRRSFM